MTTRKEINEWIDRLSNNQNYRERVREFCKRHPTWNPITQECEKIDEI